MKITNRMLRRAVEIAGGGVVETTLVGVGREGGLNGGDRAQLSVDMTGAGLQPLTLRVYEKTTSDPAEGFAPQSTTIAIPADGAVHTVTLLDLADYELRVTATQPGGAAVTVPIAWEVTAP